MLIETERMKDWRGEKSNKIVDLQRFIQLPFNGWIEQIDQRFYCSVHRLNDPYRQTPPMQIYTYRKQTLLLIWCADENYLFEQLKSNNKMCALLGDGGSA